MPDRKPVDLAAVRALLAAATPITVFDGTTEQFRAAAAAQTAANAALIAAVPSLLSSMADELEAARAEVAERRADATAAKAEVFRLSTLRASPSREECVELVQRCSDAIAHLRMCRWCAEGDVAECADGGADAVVSEAAAYAFLAKCGKP